VLVVTKATPVNTLEEFVAYAKANPRKVDYGTSGVGTHNHLVMEQFKRASGVPSMAVPYRSIGQAFTDAMGGQIAVIFPGLAAGLAASALRRLQGARGDGRQAPAPPARCCRRSRNWAYAGFDGVTWYGIVGPANLPQPIVRKLNDDINKILAQPDVRDAFKAEALTVTPMTPAQFGKHIADEVAHWTAGRARQQDRSRVA
jgi:tripartite-type tricarboxylate transporter receptor subunit TctC